MSGPNLPFSLTFLYPVLLWLLLLGGLILALGWPDRQAGRRWSIWIGLGVRLLILGLLILGLAGVQIERPVDQVTTLFVIDASDSISPADRAQAESFLRQALAQKPAGDQAGVILFGGDALVEQLPRSDNDFPLLTSLPIRTATNIEAALRLALALLPNEGGSRIILLSDGQETGGDALRSAQLAGARQVEVSVVPLGAGNAGNSAEILVEQVTAPAQARQGQSVSVAATLWAAQPTDAILRLIVDGVPGETRTVRLNRGRTQHTFRPTLTETGFHRLRVEVAPLNPADDGRLQNNWGAAFTTLAGPPQILLVAAQPDEIENLAPALEAAGLKTTHITPAALPDTLSPLTRYEAVILANVSAASLPNRVQDNLVSYVRELGRGLVMLGGPNSFGAGGYLRTPLEKALPVDMDVRDRSREPNIALVLAVDKSGSMGACHCDDPNNLQQRQARLVSGLPKVDIAKEAIFQAAVVLGNLDYLGVVSFDESAHWEVDVAQGVGVSALTAEIGGITANGQTNIFAGLVAAENQLREVSARVKHIILLTDGWSTAGVYDEIIARFAEEGITLSVVAAGSGSAGYLEDLARKGGGRYYPAPGMTEVPQIFLKETVRAAGNYLYEEPFFPVLATTGLSGQASAPLLRGLRLDAVPQLRGYNGSTAKDAARVALLTPRGDPLLATWQYGLGRSVAWTSDLSGRWGRDWLAWEEYSRFVGQLVGWTIPAPGEGGLSLAVTTQGDQLTLNATLSPETGLAGIKRLTARLLPERGDALNLELQPVSPTHYRATMTLPANGVYLAQITAYRGNGEAEEPVATQTTGIVAPYSAEYAVQPQNQSLLTEIATVSGGQTLSADPALVFAHNLSLGRRVTPIWPTLLLLTACLFPIDVALRRLRLGRREWTQVRGWLGRVLPRQVSAPVSDAPQASPSPTLQALRQIRHRTRSHPKSPPTPPPTADQPASPADSPPTPDQAPAAETDPDDTLARLRAAKRRARQ